MTSIDVRQGLTSAEVADRVARGLRNDVPDAPTRTVAEIVKANVFTRFNFLVGGLLVVILIVGPLNDALFGGVIIANTLIGIVQELRAKNTLDRLAVVSAPHARVVRDGEVVSLPMNEVVLDDVLELAPRRPDRRRRRRRSTAHRSKSTSRCSPASPTRCQAAGRSSAVGQLRGRRHRAAIQATKVGDDAYAVKLAEEARRFTLVRSELRSRHRHASSRT